MGIEKLIASIPNRTDIERKTMRTNAEARLDFDPQAGLLVAALDEFELERKRKGEEQRRRAVESLDSSPLSERVKIAFHDLESETDRRVVQVLLDYPGSTCAELSEKLGWAPNTWDMHFGSICAVRADFLRDLRGTPAEGRSANLPLLTLQERSEDNAIRYTMKPEAVEGFRLLGFRVKEP